MTMSRYAYLQNLSSIPPKNGSRSELEIKEPTKTKEEKVMKNIGKLSLALGALFIGLEQKTVADEVLDWNTILQRSVVATPSVGGAPSFRLAAIVQASVFD